MGSQRDAFPSVGSSGPLSAPRCRRGRREGKGMKTERLTQRRRAGTWPGGSQAALGSLSGSDAGLRWVPATAPQPTHVSKALASFRSRIPPELVCTKHTPLCQPAAGLAALPCPSPAPPGSSPPTPGPRLFSDTRRQGCLPEKPLLQLPNIWAGRPFSRPRHRVWHSVTALGVFIWLGGFMLMKQLPRAPKREGGGKKCHFGSSPMEKYSASLPQLRVGSLGRRREEGKAGLGNGCLPPPEPPAAIACPAWASTCLSPASNVPSAVTVGGGWPKEPTFAPLPTSHG